MSVSITSPSSIESDVMVATDSLLSAYQDLCSRSGLPDAPLPMDEADKAFSLSYRTVDEYKDKAFSLRSPLDFGLRQVGGEADVDDQEDYEKELNVISSVFSWWKDVHTSEYKMDENNDEPYLHGALRGLRAHLIHLRQSSAREENLASIKEMESHLEFLTDLQEKHFPRASNASRYLLQALKTVSPGGVPLHIRERISQLVDDCLVNCLVIDRLSSEERQELLTAMCNTLEMAKISVEKRLEEDLTVAESIVLRSQGEDFAQYLSRLQEIMGNSESISERQGDAAPETGSVDSKGTATKTTGKRTASVISPFSQCQPSKQSRNMDTAAEPSSSTQTVLSPLCYRRPDTA